MASQRSGQQKGAGRPPAQRKPAPRRKPRRRGSPVPLVLLVVAVAAVVVALLSGKLFDSKNDSSAEPAPPAATTAAASSAATTAPAATTAASAATTAPAAPAPAATTAADVTPAARTVRVYRVQDGKLAAEAQEVPAGYPVGRTALEALFGMSTFGLTIENGVATVTDAGPLDREQEAEVVATLTQFPTVQKVVVDGKTLTRLDIEAETPQILVEAPLPNDRVASPLHISGTANTFEAGFVVEILDADGKTLSRKPVTATSGTGTRGTFSDEIGFDVAKEQDGWLYAYEPSAEDGKPIHEVRIPLVLLP